MIEGGLGVVPGVRCTGVWAGFRRNPKRRDLALVVVEEGSVGAAVFTKNRFCAAPVQVSRGHLERMQSSGDSVRAVLINSGNANAATGAQGLQTAVESAGLLADALGCQAHQVFVASTGVIGVPLGIELFEKGLPKAIAHLDDHTNALAHGQACANAIMTTDTVSKMAALRYQAAAGAEDVNARYTIGGMAKGSGMIEPNMATMLAVMATDAPISQAAAQEALRIATGRSFNKVSVDSDTSTNDCAFLLSTRQAKGPVIEPGTAAFEDFVQALSVVCIDLARQIARDGEGASKLVTVNLSGAASDADADSAARAVANSPLVKTAIAGHDANWGRIAMAIGKSGADFEQEQVSISIMGMPVCSKGLTIPFNEDEALRRFQEPEIVIDIDLGAGSCATTIWTCDLTHGYITINGDYRT
jgi:glutamate N-acetyltransferase/amino-acid N-acetyltransferase